jgi:hypothetical protein
MLTNNQKEIIDSLIYEFGRMNESNSKDNDLLSYINNQLDEQSVLRAEFREKSKAFNKINQQIIADLEEQIRTLTDHFGYELNIYGDVINGVGYVGISIEWKGHEGLYKNYQSWYLKKKWKWFGDTSINSFQGLTDYGFEYSRGTQGCSDYVVFHTDRDLLKDIANEIIEVRKRSL